MTDPILPLVLFAVTSTLTPGAATTLITANRRTLRPSSLPLRTGAALGLASLGVVAGLVLTVPSAQLLNRLAGSAYLLWLAWRVGTSGPPPARAELAQPPGFLGGAGLLWLNPKGWATSLAAASSFGAAADGPWRLAAMLGAMLGLAAAGSYWSGARPARSWAGSCRANGSGGHSMPCSARCSPCRSSRCGWTEPF